jgi:hypothetical protein
MNLNNVNTTKDWLYYLSMIDTSSDPLDLLISAENIPYKKINRIRKREKNKYDSNKMPPQGCFEIP